MNYLIYFTLCGAEDKLVLEVMFDEEDLPHFLEELGKAFKDSSRFAYGMVGIDFSKVTSYQVEEGI